MISLVIRSKQPEGEAMLYTRMKIDERVNGLIYNFLLMSKNGESSALL
jgi:hypothetical protein